MTKADIVENIQDKLGLSKRDIAKVVDEVFDMIKDNVLKSKKVKITGFGNFKLKKRSKRIGRNPKTGKEIAIEARSALVFEPSQVFKKDLNG